jgi:mannose-6-phosphate isomerase-like protein (cupin superfamily)
MNKTPINLATHPIHLGLGATATVEPEFSGEMGWYEGYATRHATDGVEGRLVSMHTFDQAWDVWEMHPSGSEVVLCMDGRITLHQKNLDGTKVAVSLDAGECAVNEPGVWHTADVEEAAIVLFITAGTGTEHRPR